MESEWWSVLCSVEFVAGTSAPVKRCKGCRGNQTKSDLSDSEYRTLLGFFRDNPGIGEKMLSRWRRSKAKFYSMVS